MSRRRSNGEGSIYVRKDGRVAGAISYLDPVTGKTKRVTVYGKSRTEVREKLAKLRERLAAQQPAVDSSMKTGAWGRVWREDILPTTSKAPGTKRLYSDLSKQHIENGVLAERPLRELRPLHVNQLLASIGHYAPASRRLALQVLRQTLEAARSNGLLATNPANDPSVQRPTVPMVERNFLEPDAVLQLLDAAAPERLAPLVTVMAFTGLRTGELIGLSWDAVDLDARTVRVLANLTRVGSNLILGEPKSARSRRTVPLTAEAVDAFRAWRAQQNTERLAAGTAWTETGLVFTNTIGKATEPRHVGRIIARVADRAGVKATPHTLRHSYVSMMLEAGVPIRVVSELVGHSSTSLTSDLYGHVAERVNREATDKLDIVLQHARRRRA
jgi:integrase